MSTIFNFLQTKNNRGIFWWIRFYYEEFLNSIYQRKVSNKIDNSWKKLKIAKTITPEGWSKDNAFKHLEKEWDGKIMRRFKD
jgi:hypothetical protein